MVLVAHIGVFDEELGLIVSMAVLRIFTRGLTHRHSGVVDEAPVWEIREGIERKARAIESIQEVKNEQGQ